MPNYFTYAGYKLYFWSNEGNEPIHVHVTKWHPNPASAKFWILKNGTVELANNKAELSLKDLKKIQVFLEANFSELCRTWKNYFKIEKLKFYK